MLYHLFYPLRDVFGAFNVFRYITFRMAYATLTALLISFIVGPALIRKLQQYPTNGTVREYLPHGKLKSETPTMGGLLILLCLLIPTLLWAKLNNQYIWLTIFVSLGMGVVGFIDDWRKLVKRNPEGLSIKAKLFWQTIIALIAASYLFFIKIDSLTTRIPIPFLKDVRPDLGYFYILFAALVIVGTANAVNLTDGLDGLAIGPTIIATLTFTLLTYVTGHAKFASYLMIPHIPGSGELAIFCGATFGASLGFLWYNFFPAQVYMGDIGALALGGALGCLALIIKHELLLILIGGVFVIETISVIVQIISFKLTGKRIFQMAPLHHHFELKGWAEPKIIVRFWIIAIVLALISLSTLKLR